MKLANNWEVQVHVDHDQLILPEAKDVAQHLQGEGGGTRWGKQKV